MSATMKMKIFLSLSILAAILLLTPHCIEAHGHSHDEPSEPAAHKYSRAANEEAAAKGPEKTAQTTHTHSHGGDKHGHGHSHDDHHAHSHDHHGAADHKHEGHGHSHGSAGSDRSFKSGNCVQYDYFIIIVENLKQTLTFPSFCFYLSVTHCL